MVLRRRSRKSGLVKTSVSTPLTASCTARADGVFHRRSDGTVETIGQAIQDAVQSVNLLGQALADHPAIVAHRCGHRKFLQQSCSEWFNAAAELPAATKWSLRVRLLSSSFFHFSGSCVPTTIVLGLANGQGKTDKSTAETSGVAEHSQGLGGLGQ